MKGTPLYSFAKMVVTPIFKLLFRYRVSNQNNIPSDGKYIICCNHMSNADPIFLAMAQKRQLFYMAKSELFRSRLFAGLIRALGAFPVHRGAGDTEAISNAKTLLENGQVLGIFIEGTRSKTGELLRPKSGAAMIAYQTNTPIVPASITFKGGGRPRIFGRVTVSCSDPLTPADLGLAEGTPSEFRNASRKIMDVIAAMRKKDIQ